MILTALESDSTQEKYVEPLSLCLCVCMCLTHMCTYVYIYIHICFCSICIKSMCGFFQAPTSPKTIQSNGTQ